MKGIKERKELLDIEAKRLKGDMIHEILFELDVLIVCALPEEAEEALKVYKNNAKFSELIEKNLNGRPYWYFKLGQMKVIITWQSDVGTVEATKCIHWFLPYLINLKLLMMCGMCAGVEGEVSLGDVIVASDVLDYLNGGVEFDVNPFNLDDNLLTWSRQQASNKNWQQHILDQKPNVNSNVITGTIASGSAGKDLPNLIEQLKSLTRKTFGIDMEAIAIFQAISSSNKSFRKFVVKSVVDFGDEQKDNNSYHVYSSQASAAFSLHLLLDYFEA